MARKRKLTKEEQIASLLELYGARKLYNLYVQETDSKKREILREAWRISYRREHGS